MIDLETSRLNLKGERLGTGDQIKFWSPQHEVEKGLNSGGGDGKSKKRTNMEDLLSLIPQMFFEFLVSGSGELTK